MRKIAQETQARLDAEAATFCHCWKLVRRDGVAQGFTDHDCDLSFDGLVYAAGAGLEAAKIEHEIGLSPGGMQVSGALSAASLSETDLANGVYDGASVEIWLVDWRDTAHRVLLDTATLGDVQRGENGFTVELRSLAHRLDEVRGRRFQRGCTADLGDANCGMDLTTPSFRALARVTRMGTASSCEVDLPAHADGWFTHGVLTVRSGANAGARLAVKAHAKQGGAARIDFWTPPARPLAAGDEVELTAGCDKSFATCGSKFANSVNFRGFPHMPGNDALMRHPGAPGAAMDGGSLFR